MECCGNMAGSWLQSKPVPEAAEHAHAADRLWRKIGAILRLTRAARRRRRLMLGR